MTIECKCAGSDTDGLRNNGFDDLFLFEADRRKWTELTAAGDSKPSARYDFGLAVAGNSKVYLVGGKLSEWASSLESQYSWASVPSLDAGYDKDKGNDDIWELELTFADPSPATATWSKRVGSLYKNICDAQADAGSAEETFCSNYKGKFVEA